MPSKYWIKLYHEILDDPKMGRLPDNLWRRTTELFLMAGETDNGGHKLAGGYINECEWVKYAWGVLKNKAEGT